MKSIILNITAFLVLALAPAGLMVAPALAACPAPGSSGAQVLNGIRQTGGGCNDKKVSNTIESAVRILSYVTGVAAIIMIIVAGFKYITSGGDAGRVSSAKNTLIYAVVGLAIAALATFFVSFVLRKFA